MTKPRQIYSTDLNDTERHLVINTLGMILLPKHSIVERTFSWLNRQRRLGQDYERLPETNQAIIYVAMIRLMHKELAQA